MKKAITKFNNPIEKVTELGLKAGDVTFVFDGKKYTVKCDKHRRLTTLRQVLHIGLNFGDKIEITHHGQNVIEVRLLNTNHTDEPDTTEIDDVDSSHQFNNEVIPAKTIQSMNHNNGYTSLIEAFKKMGEAYSNLLDYFVPTRDEIGLTERNLTCYFCHVYTNLYPINTFVWFELPMKNHQHLDSIIIHKNDDNTTDIYFIESKRIYDVSYITGVKGKNKSEYESIRYEDMTSSLHKDYKRLLNLKVNKFSGISSLNSIIFEGGKIRDTVRLHVVLIASLEQIGNTKPTTISERYNTLNDFIGKFKLDKEEINIKNEYYDQQEVICKIEEGNYIKNIHLFLMHKLLSDDKIITWYK